MVVVPSELRVFGSRTGRPSAAGRLGSFLSQAEPKNIESMHITYSGALAEGKTDLVRNAAIAGLLAQSEHVNRINAATIAQERGIRILEEKHESRRGGASNVLSITLHDGSHRHFTA